MTHDWKLAVAVREDLATWQKLNLSAFVASGLGTVRPQLIGKEYVDGSGQSYLPMLNKPVLVFAGDAAGLRRAFQRALDRDLLIAIYTDDLFASHNNNDEANRAAVAAVPTEELDVAGFSVAGERKQVDKVFDKLRFHP